MKNLIIRADDFGIAPGTIPAILKGLKDGIITCTGVMINMDCAEEACQKVRENPDYCFGQDINIATGKPVADPNLVRGMLDECGNFRRSPIIRKMLKEGIEPFNYQEVRSEIEAQLNKFIKLTGKKPAYLNGHAFRSPNFSKALADTAHDYDIPCMDEIVKKYDLEHHGFDSSGSFTNGWYPSENSIENQLNADAEGYFIKHFPEMEKHETGFLICHPAYVDSSIMKVSSLNLVRIKDLDMVLSKRIRKMLDEKSIQSLTITDFLTLHSENLSPL